MSFGSLGYPPCSKAIAEEGYNTPTPIQLEAIPAVIAGKDDGGRANRHRQNGWLYPAYFGSTLERRTCAAQPGTCAYPHPPASLAAQVAESVATYGKHLPLRSTVVFGGVKINPQMMKLRKGVDILVATPGRLLDLYNQNAVRFNS